MDKKNLGLLVSTLMIMFFALPACGSGAVVQEEAAVDEVPADVTPSEDVLAEEAPDEEGAYQIPTIEEGKYNVAFVYIGAYDEGGWTQSHDAGRIWVEENVKNVSTAYVENVAEGPDSEQVLRSLATNGFDMIFATAFGYIDSAEIIADEFPDVDIIHINGDKSNEANFGNLMGAIEDMKYLAGMLAGSRTKMDGGDKIGYIATYPSPEEFRLGNAFALGVAETCPDCTIDVLWISTWDDPVIEKEAAISLFDVGASVVITDADSPIPAEVAPEGRWGITYNYSENCIVETCLTSVYWNWGPVYGRMIEESIEGIWRGGSEYFDADTGAMGLFGFMDGETMQPGTAELPEEDLTLIEDILAEMLAGDFDRFDVFSGPIIDNQGNEILAEGETLEQLDLVGISQFGNDCEICMYWWNANIITEIPSFD